MRNGTIRLRWREKGKTKFRYYAPHDFDRFLEKVESLIGNNPMRFHIYWNGTWHPCHTITDVKENLKRILSKDFLREGGF